MSRCVLTIYPDDLSAGVLPAAGQDASGAELAAAVQEFLTRHQPWLAERVEVLSRQGCAVVTARETPGPPRAGERPLELLRAVQGVLGMADRLPEVHGDGDMPEIEADAAQFDFPCSSWDEGDAAPEAVLQSKVRSFPLPEAEWYEICEGVLTLTHDRIVFEPRYWAPLEDKERSTRRHVLLLKDVSEVARDLWLHIPCLRVETQDAAYRYGWPPRREDLHSTFEVDEWLEALKRFKRGGGGDSEA